MKKLSRKLLIGVIVYFTINSGFLVQLSGPVMEENDIKLTDLILSSESRSTYKEELIKAAQDKGTEISASFFKYLKDEITPTGDGQKFIAYSKDAYDFEKRVEDKKRMDIEYKKLYPNP